MSSKPFDDNDEDQVKLAFALKPLYCAVCKVDINGIHFYHPDFDISMCSPNCVRIYGINPLAYEHEQ